MMGTDDQVVRFLEFSPKKQNSLEEVINSLEMETMDISCNGHCKNIGEKKPQEKWNCLIFSSTSKNDSTIYTQLTVC